MPEYDINSIRRTLIFVSSSKGIRLQNVVNNDLEKRIIWRCVRGRGTTATIDYIQNNVRSLVQRYGQIHIVLWTGTCDLTTKTGRFIRLNHQNSVDETLLQYERLDSIKQDLHNKVTITILECPYYSIRIWNQHKGHANSDIYKNDDLTLRNHVDSLNQGIRQLNERVGVRSPRLAVDLLRNSKSNRAYATESIAYSLLTDGIHPGHMLSRYWLKKVVCEILLKNCSI